MTTEPDTIEAEILDESTGELVPAEREAMPLPAGLFGDVSPAHAVMLVTARADALARALERPGLHHVIQGTKTPSALGWSMVRAMNNVAADAWIEREEGAGESLTVYAVAELRTASGGFAGRARALCSRSEKQGFSRPHANKSRQALRAMAESRAISAATRRALGFVTLLAGYEPDDEAEAVYGDSGASDAMRAQRPPEPRETPSGSSRASEGRGKAYPAATTLRRALLEQSFPLSMAITELAIEPGDEWTNDDYDEAIEDAMRVAGVSAADVVKRIADRKAAQDEERGR